MRANEERNAGSGLTFKNITKKNIIIMKMRAPQAFMKYLENYYEVALKSMEDVKMSLLLEKREKFSQKKKYTWGNFCM